MMQQEPNPDTEMVVIQVCHNERIHCPNVLIATADWQRVIEEWIHTHAIAERLRARVNGRKILHHHQLHISISGCPNGCSRPQIADVGLVGFVRPTVEPADCTTCGACAAACPDTAITVDDSPPVFDVTACQGCLRCRNACPTNCIHLSHPGLRVLLGGKLGRHPRLAQPAGEIYEPAELIGLLDRVVDAYLKSAKPDERFADFLLRTA
ncbi:MAG: 4Fe-4S dicluster domain-containing protein [Armatimonadota bacterium]